SPPAPFCLPFSSRHAPPLTAIYTLSLTRRSSDLDLQLAGLLGGIDQLARDGLRTRDDEAGIGIEQAALHLVFLDQREHFLDLGRSEEHTSELQSRENLVCRLLLEKKKTDSQVACP